MTSRRSSPYGKLTLLIFTYRAVNALKSNDRQYITPWLNQHLIGWLERTLVQFMMRRSDVE